MKDSMIRCNFLLCLLWVSVVPLTGLSSDLDDARSLFRAGKYQEAEAFAAKQVQEGIWNERNCGVPPP